MASFEKSSVASFPLRVLGIFRTMTLISLKKEKYYPLDLEGDLWHPYVCNGKKK